MLQRLHYYQRLLGTLLAIALLGLTVASPAVAEVGCARDALAVMQESAGVRAAVKDQSPKHLPPQPSKSLHCPGGNCIPPMPAAVASAGEPHFLEGERAYAILRAAPVTAVARGGPERPPRA